MGGKDLVATKQSKPNPTKPNRKAPRSEKPRETSLRAREPEMSIILALFARPPSNSLAGPTSKSGGGEGRPTSRMARLCPEWERKRNGAIMIMITSNVMNGLQRLPIRLLGLSWPPARLFG